ncbi:MAG: hypothetical protein WKF85_12735 [Chitinophagaceae bacterium]
MSEITYVFGAGASIKSMPIVNNFVKRFETYLNFLADINEEFRSENRNFITQIKSHLSFDTYFKKLFHQNQNELIQKNKNLLLSFFIFEHLIPLNYYYSYADPNEISDYIIDKEYHVDPRYDALVASLLKPLKGKCEFYGKVNFITWNYDLNLLFAIKNFLASIKSLQEFINTFNCSENTFVFSEQLTLVHLNGFIRHKSLEFSEDVTIEFMYAVFKELIETHNKPEQVEKNIQTINFAWENMQPNNLSDVPKFIIDSITAVKNSHSVILTGYSLPLYNRYFDEQIFSYQNIRDKYIYVRDPRSAQITETFYSDFGISRPEFRGKGDPIVYESDSCDSFFVPSNIYKASHVIKLTIDSNLINAKQKIDSVNKLEELHKLDKIQIVGAERLFEEMKNYKNIKAQIKVGNYQNIGEPFLIGHSRIGACLHIFS